MKFIKEIISRRQDETGHAEDAFEREAAASGDALDLEAYSLPREPAPAPAESAGEVTVDEDELCRLVADSTWMPTQPAEEGGQGISGTGAADEPGLLREKAPSEDDEALGRDLGERAAQRAMAALASSRDIRQAARAADEPAERPRPSSAPEPAAEETPEPGDGPQFQREPVTRLRPRAHPQEAAIAELPDPFDRLEAEGAGPAPVVERERSSPFQRPETADRRPPAPPERSPRADRPRTRLSGDLSAQLDREGVEMPSPAVGRAARRSGRVVKTRLLGFGDGVAEPDPFDPAAAALAGRSAFPTGWIVVIAGPGRGHAFTLFNGVSQIGRGEDQAVRLDFGDTSISRSNHAAVAYDQRRRKFYLGHGGKANLVRLNGKPVLSTEELPDGSIITIGETTLRFVALCGAEFDWDRTGDDDVERAVFG